MPQDRRTRGDARISTQRSSPWWHKESDSFLDFLFSDIAHRPDTLTLRETAAVARFLLALARGGVAPDDAADSQTEDSPHFEGGREDAEKRVLLSGLARIIWMDLLQFGKINACGKQVAARFLRRHRDTYLAGKDVSSALEAIEYFEVPERDRPLFQPPHLIARTFSAQGVGNPYLKDDLTERIYTGYHVLKLAREPRIRPRIAEALERAGAATVARKRARGARWTWQDVNERIKEYDKRLRKRFREQGTKERVKQAVDQWRDSLVDRWAASFQARRAEQEFVNVRSFTG